MIYVVSNRAGYQFFRFSLNTLLRIEVRDLSSRFERLVWHRARRTRSDAPLSCGYRAKHGQGRLKNKKNVFLFLREGKMKKEKKDRSVAWRI